jgi:hypothetical protein
MDARRCLHEARAAERAVALIILGPTHQPHRISRAGRKSFRIPTSSVVEHKLDRGGASEKKKGRKGNWESLTSSQLPANSYDHKSSIFNLRSVTCIAPNSSHSSFSLLLPQHHIQPDHEHERMKPAAVSSVGIGSGQNSTCLVQPSAPAFSMS